MKTVFAIGVGPGRKDWLTMAALEALEKCTFVAGYKLYLDGIKELLTGNHLVEADDKSGGTAENKGVDFSIFRTEFPLQ